MLSYKIILLYNYPTLLFIINRLQLLTINTQNRHLQLMIFKSHLKQSAKSKPKQPTWKQRLRMSLYNQNYNKVRLVHKAYNLQEDGRRNVAAENLIKAVRKIDKKYNQPTSNEEENVNHLYCCYVPLKKSVQLDDEIVNTFIYLRNLKQSNNLHEQDNFYTQIRKFIQKCKQQGKLKQGWSICLKRFIVNLDVITKIEIFMYLLKYGSQILPLLHKNYAKHTLIDVFIRQIFSVNQHFEKQLRINKTWKISLQLSDKINEANISKTMKMLYCSICLIYDCGKHKLQDVSHQKDYHYVSPKNKIDEQTHLENAIELLKYFKQLDQKCTLKDSQFCSKLCFKKINSQIYKECELKKSWIISPMTESLIKIGIQIFSYKPCLILNLFPKNMSSNVTINCSIIFMYLIEQLNLQQRLYYKLKSNQVDFLMNENSDDRFSKAYGRNRSMCIRNKKKKKIQQEQFKYQQVAICMHNFIGEEAFDQPCLNCICSKRGFCLPECQCTELCPIITQGCSCKSKQDCQSIKCSCYKAKMQCIPGICVNCFRSCNEVKKNLCKNDQILRGVTKKINIGLSKIPNAGFGAFAGQKIKKGSLISTYCGQIVDQQMETMREFLKKGESFYNFGCTQGSIDARFMGNKTRFINHGNQTEGKTNLVSLNMFSCGQQYIGLYALKDIQQGQQLLFDYDGEGLIAQKHSEMHSFLKKDAFVKIERLT